MSWGYEREGGAPIWENYHDDTGSILVLGVARQTRRGHGVRDGAGDGSFAGGFAIESRHRAIAVAGFAYPNDGHRANAGNASACFGHSDIVGSALACADRFNIVGIVPACGMLGISLVRGDHCDNADIASACNDHPAL